MLSALLSEIVDSLSWRYGVEREVVESALAQPPDPKLGDFALSLAFPLAKRENKHPLDIAKDLAQYLERLPSVAKASLAGPYVNFVMTEEWWLSQLDRKWQLPRLRVAIEYPSVNPNKPWHIGHLRNALLGESLARFLAWAGQEVVRVNYINDLGLQIAQTAYYVLKRFGNLEEMKKACGGKIDVCVGKMYVEASALAEKEEKEVRALLKEMESGEGRAKLVRELCELVLSAQEQTGAQYGVRHDVVVFESDLMRDLFAEGMALLEKSPAVKRVEQGEKAGCVVAECEIDGKKEEKVLIRSDGTATYTGKDVVFQLWKFGIIQGEIAGQSLEAEEVVNIIGAEQRYPQMVIKQIIRSLGYKKESEHYFHIAYEHVVLKEGKFSGRKGTWIGYTADDLLLNALARVKSRSPSLSEEDARAVAVGAIAYALLRQSPEKKIVFDWDRVLSLEGDSGPYVQYAFVRAKKILERGGETSIKPNGFEGAELALLKSLVFTRAKAFESAQKKRPHILCAYTSELAAAFHKFYDACPVLGAEEERRKARLWLVSRFCAVLRECADLLLLPLPDRM